MENFTGKTKDLFALIRKWIILQIDYTRITVAEKLSLLLGILAIGLVCMIFGAFFILLVSLALVEVFKTFLAPWLAYICVSGIYLVFIGILLMARKVLLINPLARFISKLLMEKEKKEV